MTAVSSATVAWRGTGDETERLLAAVARDRGCGFGPASRSTLNLCRARDAESAVGRYEQEAAGWRRATCE
jgi:hypothetical protein